MKPIIIYEIRENYAISEPDKEDRESIVISSEPRGLFQTMASAQIEMQSMLNLKLAARLQSAQHAPAKFENTPEAMAELAANRLCYDVPYYKRTKSKFPVLFIKEITVPY